MDMNEDPPSLQGLPVHVEQDYVALGIVTHHRPRRQHVHELTEHVCENIKIITIIIMVILRVQYYNRKFSTNIPKICFNIFIMARSLFGIHR